MNHAHSHDQSIPKPLLAMALALVGVSLLMTGAVRAGLAPREAVPAIERSKSDVRALETRHLRFLDQTDGSVLVEDADNDSQVSKVVGEANGGGFIRGVMRGLARERKMRGIGPEPAFALTRWSDGGISLSDSATGREIELGSFGPDNRKAFARFLVGSAT